MRPLNYLLISPGKLKTTPQNANPVIEEIAAFPIGLAYVSAAMKMAGLNVYTMNAAYANHSLESALETAIRENAIDIVCTGGKCVDVSAILQMITIVRTINAKAKIVVGGPIITADPATAMKVLGADVGVIGEGEETMCELACALNTNSFIGDVPGLIFWQNGQLLRSQTRPEIANVDEIPVMDFDGFQYSQWLEVNGHAGIIHSARSCPYKCTFCFKSTGNKYRQRSLDLVFKEIDYQIEKYQIKSLMMTDELFAAKKKRLLEFCERIKPYGMSWGVSLRVPEIEPDLLRLMRDAGCRGISTGFESGADQILKSMRKAATAKQVEHALHVLASSDMNVLGNFIFGDVSETQETVDKSIELWKRYNQNVYINLGIVAAYPGTSLYEQAVGNGLIANKEEFLKEGHFYLNMTSMADQEYFDMVSKITELGFLPQVPAKSVSILNVVDEEFCDVQWRCRNCGQASILNNAQFLQAPLCHCACGTPNVIEPFRDVSCNEQELVGLLPPDGLIGFWGTGSQYCRLAKHYNCLASERYIQVDANRYYQKLTRLRRRIHDPSVIGERKIESVVITSPLAKESILKSIRDGYPTVSSVFYPKLLDVGGKLVPSFRPIERELFCG